MPTLTAALQAALAGPITKPITFYEIGFSTMLYWCSRSTTLWNGIYWSSIGAAPSRIVQRGDGTLETSLAISDPGASVSTLVLSEGASGQTAKIWIGDADALADADPVLFFDGVLDGAQISGDGVVTLTMRTLAEGKDYTPRQVFGPPVFNYLPVPGAQIQWGTETYIIGG